MTTKIIFLCPHNAAKSVAAAAFLARQAAERGLAIEIATAGTHPDPEVLPVVRARLDSEGLAINHAPRRVTEDDLSAADVIVNIGCDGDDLPTCKTPTEWHIPDFSADPDAAFMALETHVADLANRLTVGPGLPN